MLKRIKLDFGPVLVLMKNIDTREKKEKLSVFDHQMTPAITSEEETINFPSDPVAPPSPIT